MLKLIVVEDEPAVRRELVLLTPWEDLGIACVGEAEDGIRGLELAEKVRPDIIMTDIRMPGMDGLDLIEKLVESATGSGGTAPEFIILSGHSEFEYARTAMRLGVDEYLLKPVEDDALVKALERVKRRLAERSARSIPEKAFFSERLPEEGPNRPEGYVDGAIRLIKDRYIQGITIEEAASKLGISSNHLSRLFKKQTGSTFIDYLTHIRVKRAIELLRDPKIKVYEVADLVGYADARYFSQVFRNITGTTPREFKDDSLGRARRPNATG